MEIKPEPEEKKGQHRDIHHERLCIQEECGTRGKQKGQAERVCRTESSQTVESECRDHAEDGIEQPKRDLVKLSQQGVKPGQVIDDGRRVRTAAEHGVKRSEKDTLCVLEKETVVSRGLREVDVERLIEIDCTGGKQRNVAEHKECDPEVGAVALETNHVGFELEGRMLDFVLVSTAERCSEFSQVWSATRDTPGKC